MAASRRRANPASRRRTISSTAGRAGLTRSSGRRTATAGAASSSAAPAEATIDPPAACADQAPAPRPEALARGRSRSARARAAAALDADDGCGRMLLRAIAAIGPPIECPTTIGRSRPVATTASWTARRRSRPRAAAAPSRLGGRSKAIARRPGGRASSTVHTAGRTSSRAGRRSGGRARRRRRAIAGEARPAGPGGSAGVTLGLAVANSGIGVMALSVASCGRPPRCRDQRRAVSPSRRPRGAPQRRAERHASGPLRPATRPGRPRPDGRELHERLVVPPFGEHCARAQAPPRRPSREAAPPVSRRAALPPGARCAAAAPRRSRPRCRAGARSDSCRRASPAIPAHRSRPR